MAKPGPEDTSSKTIFENPAFEEPGTPEAPSFKNISLNHLVFDLTGRSITEKVGFLSFLTPFATPTFEVNVWRRIILKVLPKSDFLVFWLELFKIPPGLHSKMVFKETINQNIIFRA